MQKTIIVLALMCLALAGCQTNPNPLAILAAIPSVTPYPTYTVLPPLATLTPYPTYTQIPTQTPFIVIVTATSSPTPLSTATFTMTPTKTQIPLPTSNPLLWEKGAGNYLVNVDIAPGIWRNNGTSDNCHWKRSTRNGDTIENYLGKGGGTINIAASDYRVELDWTCGIWIFVG